jgi:hypothetical protein
METIDQKKPTPVKNELVQSAAKFEYYFNAEVFRCDRILLVCLPGWTSPGIVALSLVSS